ncbi:disease resistance protein RUN1-like [Rosa chinensis]|uniref:disease resistance protein RUN1-like n=1 Tax=Rosa chinensis TaxID=74649 RepID=UPI000D0976AB|nr:disease resistance protein RUN1-like [Rosa chinensis]
MMYKALDREKIKTFFDDHTLKRGENISAALFRAIEVSKISVVICSENYALSSWCLDELVKILECQKSKQQIVIPVFYKVDPAHVRHQTGSFGQALARVKYNKDKVPRWKAALTQVANLSGWTYVDGYESDFIEKIVKEILDVVGLNDQKTKQ